MALLSLVLESSTNEELPIFTVLPFQTPSIPEPITFLTSVTISRHY